MTVNKYNKRIYIAFLIAFLLIPVSVYGQSDPEKSSVLSDETAALPPSEVSVRADDSAENVSSEVHSVSSAGASSDIVEAAEKSGEANQAGLNHAALTPEEEAEILKALAEDQTAVENNASNSTGNIFNSVVSAVQSMNPDMAVTGDFALAWFSQDKNYQAGAHDPSAIGFQLQQVEMTLGASVDHIFRADINLVFMQAGVELEEAYVTTLCLPWNLQVRAGQFLSRFGRINPTHPHAWDFVDQAFVIGKFFGAEGNRGLGLEISWLAPIPWYLEAVVSAQMASSSASNRSYLGADDDTEGVQDFLYTLAIKQFFSLHERVGLFWGLNAQTGPNSTGRNNRTNIFSTDLHLMFQPEKYPEMSVVFQAEAMFRLRQVPKDVLFDGAGYAQIVWHINREWETGVRGEYGSGVENDPLDPFWTEDRYRASLQASWLPSHFSRIRAQASIDIPTWESNPIYALFLSLEFTAGTHPAHNY